MQKEALYFGFSKAKFPYLFALLLIGIYFLLPLLAKMISGEGNQLADGQRITKGIQYGTYLSPEPLGGNKRMETMPVDPPFSFVGISPQRHSPHAPKSLSLFLWRPLFLPFSYSGFFPASCYWESLPTQAKVMAHPARGGWNMASASLSKGRISLLIPSRDTWPEEPL